MNSNRKTKKAKKAGPSEKTSWAYWMQAIEPTDPAINATFPGYHPMWVQHSQRLVVGAENFKSIRRHFLNITQTQAAAYLRVSLYELQAWEQGKKPVPFMAFELLRLVWQSTLSRMSHKAWDGWFIDKDGFLISPDAGRLKITPAELSYMPMLLNLRDTMQREIEQLRKNLNAQEAENTRLRTLFQTQGITQELETMQDRLAALLASIQTAQVIPFPTKTTKKEATA